MRRARSCLVPLGPPQAFRHTARTHEQTTPSCSPAPEPFAAVLAANETLHISTFPHMYGEVGVHSFIADYGSVNRIGSLSSYLCPEDTKTLRALQPQIRQNPPESPRSGQPAMRSGVNANPSWERISSGLRGQRRCCYVQDNAVTGPYGTELDPEGHMSLTYGGAKALRRRGSSGRPAGDATPGARCVRRRRAARRRSSGAMPINFGLVVPLLPR